MDHVFPGTGPSSFTLAAVAVICLTAFALKRKHSGLRREWAVLCSAVREYMGALQVKAPVARQSSPSQVRQFVRQPLLVKQQLPPRLFPSAAAFVSGRPSLRVAVPRRLHLYASRRR
jgi:hypothetical protein